jgi:hypothetical protein
VPAVSPVKLREVDVIPLIVFHEEDDEAFHWRLYFVAFDTLLQLTVALVVPMLEELKPVGVPQPDVLEPLTTSS